MRTARELAAGRALFEASPRSVLFVTSQLRARELKMAEGLRGLGWKVGLVHHKWTPFDPAPYFDFAIEVPSAQAAHAAAVHLKPRLTHVFSGAIDDYVLLMCRRKPSPVVIDLNDVFAPSLFDYCHERFEPTREALSLADGFCARDLQAKHAQRVDGFRLPPHVLFFPEYCWDHPPGPAGAAGFPGDEVHVVSVGTFSLETQGMYDSGYLALTRMLVAQGIHFHIYPHWMYRRDHFRSPHADFEKDFADYIALGRHNPCLHLHDSLPTDELARVLPRYDFGIVSGGCQALGQKLKFYHPAYIETCYSGRISDYLDAGLPVLLNDEVKFDWWLLERLGACVDLKGVLKPGFKEELLRLKNAAGRRETMRRATATFSIRANSPRLAARYERIIESTRGVAYFDGVREAGEEGQPGTGAPRDGERSATPAGAPLPWSTALSRKLAAMAPRVARVLLPYRTIRLLEVRLHEALQQLDASLWESENRDNDVAVAQSALLREVAKREEKVAAAQAALSRESARREEEIAAAQAALSRESARREEEVAVLRALLEERDRRAAGLEQELEGAQGELGRKVAELGQQVHVLSNEKFALQQERLIGGRTIHDLAGLLGWPQILDESARMNGFAELLRVVGLFSSSQFAVDGPSACWTALGTKNYDQLLTDGYANFKRTIATNYFNFLVQGGDPQIAAVEGLVSAEARARARTQADVAPDDPALRLPDQAAYRYFVLLLWEYARSIDGQGLLPRLREPAEGNPIVVRTGDAEASQDLANSVVEYYAFESHLRKDGPASVLEIGGGYGRNAFVILSLNEQARMTLVDIPPALFVAQRYLTSVLPGRRVFRVRDFARYEDVREEMEACSVAFLMPHQLALLPERHFDLGLNISSFGEMSAEQLAWYFRELSRVIGGHFYMKQWAHSRNVFDGLDLREGDYPIPAHWTKTWSRPCPVQREFFEAIYRGEAA